jgi:molybdenum cofactor synthesis domain-containing protein
MTEAGDSAPRVVETAAALLIGNELLSGKVRDANLERLGRTLHELGIRLARVLVVPDEREVIAGELRELSEAYDVVFTSGGMGPTHDDVTIVAVAQAFDCPVVVEPRFEELLRRLYGERCTEAHLRMARIPSGACLAGDGNEWPAIVARNVWILPGLPEVFAEKLAIVRTYLRGPRPFCSRAVLAATEEPGLVALLDAVVSAHPSVEVGSYPKWFDPEYKTRITFDAPDPDAMRRALEHFLSLLPSDALVRVE